MKRAWSVYLNQEISAEDALRVAASTRPVCPRCGELVHLVRRVTAPHFAHWPHDADSPNCSLRTEGDHTSASTGYYGPPREERLRESEAFRQALLETHRLVQPEPPDAALAALFRRVAKLLQETRRHAAQAHGGQSMTSERRDVFPSFAEAIIREALRPPNLKPASLYSDDHRHQVLGLWQHLHQPQVEEDLIFLLSLAWARAGISADELAQTSNDLVYMRVVDRLLATSLWLLARVPWSELRSKQIEQCDDCGDVVENARYCTRCEVPLCEEHAKQHEKFSCPDCGQRPCDTRRTGPFDKCVECEEWVCSECYKPCPSCGEAVCEDCEVPAHLWSCEGCGDEFCENRVEQMDKRECSSCDRPFCENCADEQITSCPGCKKEICRQCGTECEDCDEVVCGDCEEKHAADHAAEE